MRYYDLLNFQHVVLFVVPTVLFVIIFAFALGYSHFWSLNARRRKKAIVHSYPDGIDGRNAPFPLAMLLIVAGTVVWAFLYIFFNGCLGVRI